jgi:hypothetical protein
MMTKLLSKSRALLLTLVVGLLCSANAFGSATIVIQNNDAPGVGFNDPTPVAPIGGNSGITLGQQRFNAFQFAANIWGATITSGPTITVRATWAALDCTANSAVLGSAGSTNLHRNFTNAPFADTWFPTALANALSGTDLNGTNAEISARFNLNIGTTGCLENKPWYYGLDTNHTSQRVNLVTVVLHELGHGLGFASFTNEETGQLFTGSNGIAAPSVYDRFLLDDTTGKTWPQMTNAERVASAINNHNLVWNGPQVVADASLLTGGKDSSGRPQLFAPSPVDSGSSVSHWDTFAAPNQLMEPFISTNLSLSVTTPQDLTFSLLKDIGWCTSCPAPTPTPPPGPPPANDNFASAQTVSGCSGTVSGNNNNATKEAGEPSHNPDTAAGADPGGASVWYQWQAPSTGSVTIDLASTEGAPHDTMLGVYTGNSVGALTAIAKNDDIVNGTVTNSRVQFTATAGTIYKIAAAGWGGAQGNFTLSWTQVGCVQVTPAILIEEGTASRAVVLDSVTLMRGPFRILNLLNFSADHRTRVMIFTSNLGAVSASDLSVQAQGVQLPIESIGTVRGLDTSSYIIVKLVDGLPVGDLSLSVTRRGVPSNTAILSIAP